MTALLRRVRRSRLARDLREGAWAFAIAVAALALVCLGVEIGLAIDGFHPIPTGGTP